MGFSVHLADPSKLSLIFMTAKKNDRGDSYKLAKLLRLKELPDVHLSSRTRMFLYIRGYWILAMIRSLSGFTY